MPCASGEPGTAFCSLQPSPAAKGVYSFGVLQPAYPAFKIGTRLLSSHFLFATFVLAEPAGRRPAGTLPNLRSEREAEVNPHAAPRISRLRPPPQGPGAARHSPRSRGRGAAGRPGAAPRPSSAASLRLRPHGTRPRWHTRQTRHDATRTGEPLSPSLAGLAPLPGDTLLASPGTDSRPTLTRGRQRPPIGCPRAALGSHWAPAASAAFSLARCPLATPRHFLTPFPPPSPTAAGRPEGGTCAAAPVIGRRSCRSGRGRDPGRRGGLKAPRAGRPCPLLLLCVCVSAPSDSGAGAIASCRWEPRGWAGVSVAGAGAVRRLRRGWVRARGVREERRGLPGAGLMGSRITFGFSNFQPSVSYLLKSWQEMLTQNYRENATNKDNEHR